MRDCGSTRGHALPAYSREARWKKRLLPTRIFHGAEAIIVPRGRQHFARAEFAHRILSGTISSFLPLFTLSRIKELGRSPIQPMPKIRATRASAKMYRVSHERHPFAIYKDWGDIFNLDDEVVSVSSEVSLSSLSCTSEKPREVHRSESICFADVSSDDKLIVPFAATASDIAPQSPSSDESDVITRRESGRRSFLKSLKDDWRKMSSRFSEKSLLSDTEGDDEVTEPKAPRKQQGKQKSASYTTARATNPNLWDSCPDIRADDLYKSFEDDILKSNKDEQLRKSLGSAGAILPSMDRRARRATRRVSLTSKAA